VSYEKYPDSVLSGLSKVGGLIALLNISFLLNLLNHYWFEKKIKRDIKELEAEKGDNQNEGIQTAGVLQTNNNEESLIDTSNRQRNFRDRFTFEFIYK
jgi:hypothetical protein